MTQVTSDSVCRHNKIILAVGVTACTGCLLGAGSLILYSKLSRKTDYADLKREFSILRREVDSLKNAVSKLQVSDDNRAVSRGSANSLDSENDNVEQFFDALSSLTTPSLPYVSPPNELASDSLEKLFKTTDHLLSCDSDSDRAQAYNLMRQSFSNFQNEWTFLWRYARAIYLYGQTFLNKDEIKRRSFCEEAKRVAFKALELHPDDAEIHKWCALTTGTLSEFVGMKQKIEDGYKFKIHIDKALLLKPDDPVLHHLCGRWCFGVASLTWIERKVAATIFAAPPTSTYDEALSQFLEAEKLKPDWIENTLFVAKCYVAKYDSASAKKWLKKANEIENIVSSDDIAAKKEVETLLAQYR